MRRIAWILALGLLPCTAWAQPQRGVEIFHLENGLRVILDPMPWARDVHGMIVVNVGGKHESPQATGLAHYLEHMLFKGTDELGTRDWPSERPYIDSIFALYDRLAQCDVPSRQDSLQAEINRLSVRAAEFVLPNEFDRLVKQGGGVGMNAMTSWDQTLYFNSFPESELARWLALYSHRFQHPVFRGFQSELEVVFEERNMSADVIFTGLLERFLSSLYPTLPYGQRPLIGYDDHLKRPSLSRMQTFFDSYYVASNMTLILAGNFSVEQARPLVSFYFGVLPRGDVPEAPPRVERAFHGVQQEKVRMLPVRMGALAFRLPGVLDSSTEVVDQVLMRILSNGRNGLLDSLMQGNEVLLSLGVITPFADAPAAVLLFVPKPLIQSTGAASRDVLAALEALRQGQFSDSLLLTVKHQLIREVQLADEQPPARAMRWARAIQLSLGPESVLCSADRIAQVGREEVQERARAIFGEDYLFFRNAFGFSRRAHLAKPNFSPIVQRGGGRSPFAQRFDSIPSHRPSWTPLAEGNSYRDTELPGGARLLTARNPMNSLSSVTVQIPYDRVREPFAPFAWTMLAASSPSGMSLARWRDEMAYLGADFSFSSDREELKCTLRAPDQHLDSAVAMLERLVSAPRLEKAELKRQLRDMKLVARVNRRSIDYKYGVLRDFAIFGAASPHLVAPSRREHASHDAEFFSNMGRGLASRAGTVHYFGPRSHDSARRLLTPLVGQIPWAGDSVPQLDPLPRPDTGGVEIVFLHHADAKQSKIGILSWVDPPDSSDYALVKAFNTYLDGGFSGILMQEIREFRALAYHTSGKIALLSPRAGRWGFLGVLFTQTDKTLEALDAYLGLLDSLPCYPDRLPDIRRYLLASMHSQLPSLRAMTPAVARNLSLWGCPDTRTLLEAQIDAVTWERLYAFYQRQIQPARRTVFIVGDRRSGLLDDLRRKYPVREVKWKDLSRE